MQLNGEFSQRVVIHAADRRWQASPAAGVERQMLDRIGEEVARATSIVRYAPGSKFDAHTHGGGEEFLVLQGTFSDELGDYGPWCYVRNPPSSRHTPSSGDGCIIFVKLWQMDLGDRTRVVVDASSGFTDGADEGVQVRELCTRDDESVQVERWAAGARCGPRRFSGGLEYLVLSGELEDEHGTYPTGSWVRNPPGFVHAALSPRGCTLWCKRGHLLEPRQLTPG